MKHNNNKIIAIIYLIISICFYVGSAICFLYNQSSIGVIQLCLGSTFLCLTAANNNKVKSIEKNENDESKN